MIEGAYLGAPPVNVPARGRRVLTHSLLRGVSAYAQGAGGFDRCAAVPAGVQPFAAPGPPHQQAGQLSQLYRMHPGLMKQQLQRQFQPTARPNGYTPPIPRVRP